MKKILYTIAASVLLMTIGAEQADAQMGKKGFITAGWQYNAPISNPVSSVDQGYGGFIDLGYYIAPRLAVGGFISFSNNIDYAAEETFYFDGDKALTTDVSTGIYQLPFGALVRFRTGWKDVQPFVQAKIGANYSSQSTYMSHYMSMDENWGVYLSPEIGIAVFPFYKHDIGLSLSVYYSYASNRGEAYDFNSLNNAGFKLGILF